MPVISIDVVKERGLFGTLRDVLVINYDDRGVGRIPFDKLAHAVLLILTQRGEITLNASASITQTEVDRYLSQGYLAPDTEETMQSLHAFFELLLQFPDQTGEMYTALGNSVYATLQKSTQLPQRPRNSHDIC